MEILQEIGSYAGLAAVLGLAVLSALYFSQARDVKRLREWAGRSPERGPEPVTPPRVAARPVPRAPGQALPAAQRANPAAAAAAGAAAATALGPATATPAAARAAEAARTDEDAPDGDDEETPGDGTLSQDTVIHPPPAPPEDDQDEDEDLPAEDTGDYDRVEDDQDDDEEWDETGDHPIPAPEEHWGETGDEPAVTPSTPPLTPAPLTPAPSLPGRPAPATAAGSASGGSILPPYAESKPGAAAAGRGGLFSSRGRGIGVVAAIVLVLAATVFGATRILGGDDPATDNAASKGTPSKSAAGGGSETDTTPTKSKRKGVPPATVRVAVLNGTTTPGLAAQIGDSIEKQGFKLGTVTNFNDQQRAESVVLYAPGAEREAAEVGRRLKISQREPIDPESQSVAGDATVVVVTGRDKTQ